MEPLGRWAWVNQYANIGANKLSRRSKQVSGIIIKYGLSDKRDTIQSAGVPWAVEHYCYPSTTSRQGIELAQWYDAGAEFVVINAEIEWAVEPAQKMRDLINTIRSHSSRGNVPLFASVDTRGVRTTQPYQEVLSGEIVGWMPMIYPKAFGQSPQDAFRASLGTGQRFAGKPVYPTIQTYDNIGAVPVVKQNVETAARDLPGNQAYTISHATDEEWEAYTRGYVPEGKDTDEMWLEQTIIGFDGKPIEFEWMVGGAPNYPTTEGSLDHKTWILLMEMGLIVRTVSR